jgi:hypothetical protein
MGDGWPRGRVAVPQGVGRLLKMWTKSEQHKAAAKRA